MPYRLICDGQQRSLGDQKYLLSPLDLAAFDLLPRLIEAGVSAFKIEGRLKTAEYVASVTRHYREAIDSAVAGQPVELAPATDRRDAAMFLSRLLARVAGRMRPQGPRARAHLGEPRCVVGRSEGSA